MLPQLIKSATAGGVFRLPGGFLTDLFGRSRVLTDSIPLCTFSSLVSAVLTQFLPETKLESLTD